MIRHPHQSPCPAPLRPRQVEEILQIRWRFCPIDDPSTDGPRVNGTLTLALGADAAAIADMGDRTELTIDGDLGAELVVGRSSQLAFAAPVVVKLLRRGDWTHLRVHPRTTASMASPTPKVRAVDDLLVVVWKDGDPLFVRSGVPQASGLRGGTYERAEVTIWRGLTPHGVTTVHAPRQPGALAKSALPSARQLG